MLLAVIASIVLAVPGPAPGDGLRLVVLDPGHGGSNLGAPARYAPGTFEKHLTLEVARLVAERLRAADVEVVLTREGDEDVSIRARIETANRLGADAFLSIHFNDTERPGPSGHESFFLSLKATDQNAARLAEFENRGQRPGVPRLRPDAPVAAILRDLSQARALRQSERLGGLIQKHVGPKSPYPNLGVRQAPFHVLMGAAVPAIVWEGGFLNHYREGRWLLTDAAQRRLADGLAAALLEFGRVAPPVDRRVPNAYAPFKPETAQ